MKEYSASITVGVAKQEDLSDILGLLDECELPREGLAAHIATTIVARYGKEFVGCSAVELYEGYALLRSVAVKRSFRGSGLGVRLTKEALDLAKDHRVKSVYLLTETASPFFSKLGFATIPRSDVPQEVKNSIEFTTLCPDTATVMMMSMG